jgi:hypothetical protein
MFDSGELAFRSEAIRARARGPELSLSPADAAALGAAAGDSLTWTIDGEDHVAALRIDPGQVNGVVGYTRGASELAHLAFAEDVTLRAVPSPIIASDGAG